MTIGTISLGNLRMRRFENLKIKHAKYSDNEYFQIVKFLNFQIANSYEAAY